MSPFTQIEHTADLGLAVWAESAEQLFAEAARGMFSMMVPLDQVAAIERREVRSAGDGLDEILIRWLNDLLFLWATEHLLLCRFRVNEITDEGVRGEAWGERYTESRHDLGAEVKAATYHDCRVERGEGRWKVRIIFDT